MNDQFIFKERNFSKQYSSYLEEIQKDNPIWGRNNWSNMFYENYSALYTAIFKIIKISRFHCFWITIYPIFFIITVWVILFIYIVDPVWYLS